MKAVLTFVLLLVLGAPTFAGDKPGSLTFKMVGSDSADINLKYGLSRKSFSYNIGYGALLGGTFNQLNGYSGSGLNYSGFSTLNDTWLGLRTPLAAGQSLLGNSYGKNGMNLSFQGLVSEMTYSGAYSGATNSGVFTFGSPDSKASLLGNSLVSGKGVVLFKDSKMSDSRVEATIKF